MEKLLTIVIPARNDNYKENFKNRLSNSVNYISKKTHELKYSNLTEIIIVDWNSENPIENDLFLINEAIQICRFVNINPTLASKIMPPGKVFNLPCAINAGIRRIESKFAMFLTSDMVLSEYALKNLYEVLLGKTDVPFDLYNQISLISTKSLPFDPTLLSMNLYDIDDIICRNGPELRDVCKDLPGTGLGTIPLMSKQMWFKFRGFNEKWIHYGWHEEDITLRVTQEFPWKNLSFLGIHALDIQEPLSNKDIRQTVNPHKTPFNIVPNDENWGLGNHKINKVSLDRSLKLELKKKSKTDNKSKLKISDFYSQIKSKSTLSNLYKPGRINFDKEKVDWEVYTLLSWYGVYQKCSSFIQLGIKDYQNSLITVQKFPCSNLFVIDSWRNKKNSIKPHLLSDILRRNGYRGHLRFVSGDENTGLKRLISRLDSKLFFDLSIVQISSIKDNLSENIKILFKYSSKVSMIIIIHDKPGELQKIISEEKKYLKTSKVFLTKSGLAAIILRNLFLEEINYEQTNFKILDLGYIPNWKWMVKSNYNRILKSPFIYHIYFLKFFKKILRYRSKI